MARLWLSNVHKTCAHLLLDAHARLEPLCVLAGGFPLWGCMDGIACGALRRGAVMRCRPFAQPAFQGIGAILRLFRSFDLVTLAVRRHEIVRGMLTAISQRQHMVERKVGQSDGPVAKCAEPASRSE